MERSKFSLHPETQQKLKRLRPRERRLLSSLFKKFCLGRNKAGQILELLEEISYKEAKSIPMLLKEKNILKFTSENSPRKSAFRDFRSYLLSRRYPEFFKAKTKFEELIKALRLPAQIKIKDPGFFEEKIIRIQISSRSKKELNALVNKLKYNLKNKDWEGLFKILE